MPSIRKTKTASGATAIQIVQYEKRKTIVMKHIGSAHTSEEISALIESADAWIAHHTPVQTLFGKTQRRTLALHTAQYIGVTHMLAYKTLHAVAHMCGFSALNEPLLLDLAIMRIVEPASKLRTIELLKRYFNIRYAKRSVYRILPKLIQHKKDVEAITVAWAKNGYSSDLALVLYDVTTLYFETFKADDLRIPGFSKDNKAQQPQIVVGLLVTREGFPLGYEVFKGNTFEGHTMLPVVQTFVRAHGVAMPVVVADAAMLSRENMHTLTEQGFSYIVGARLGNCSPSLIKTMSTALAGKDNATERLHTQHGTLICAFSSKRYRKDKADMEKQIVKAQALVHRGEPGRRAKFVKKAQEGGYVFDEDLRAKTVSLLGMKGYYTNIPIEVMDDSSVISRYHDLWNVEAAFRMSKNDLATRPIFHRTEDAIRAHVLVCFVALALGKHLENATRLSLRHVVDILWNVTDAHIMDTASGEQVTLRSPLNEDTRTILKQLRVSY